jgi:hypothetical protein
MWSIAEVVIGLAVLGVVVGLAVLAGPQRNAAVGGRAKHRQEAPDGQTENGDPPPPQFPGPFFPGG